VSAVKPKTRPPGPTDRPLKSTHPMGEFTLRQNQRLPAEMYATRGQACSFAVRCYRHSAPFESAKLADAAVDVLTESTSKDGCELNAYCVMPDHIHVLLTPIKDENSSLTAIDRFKGRCSHRLHQLGWQGKLWQPRSYDRLIRNDEVLAEVVSYIHGNPVRLQMCERPEEYPWSGPPDVFMGG
jgi:REP element-mobilizing transposase RayT